MNTNTDDLRALRTIQYGLLGGVLLLGIIAFVLVESTGPLASELTPFEDYLVIGMAVLLLTLFGGTFVVRRQRTAATTPDAQRSQTIIGWAIVEAGGILGGVYLLLLGDPTFWAVGFAMQLFVVFVVLPLPNP